MKITLPRRSRWWLLPPLLLALAATAWLLAATAWLLAPTPPPAGVANAPGEPPPQVSSGTAQGSVAGEPVIAAVPVAEVAAEGGGQGAAQGMTEGAAPGGGNAPPAVADIFAVRSWEPPPPPVAAAPPPPPAAPPLPFRFLGRIAVHGGGVSFMLAHDQRVLVVGVGDTIADNYRLEKYEKDQLLFRYRPMNIRQALPTGGGS